MSGQSPAPAVDLLENILRRCAEAAPEPWYPKLYAQTSGVARDSLDHPLERLRLAGLVRLTDWVQGCGQGYVLTSAGTRALANPRLLTQLRDGKVPLPQEIPDATPPLQPKTQLYQQRVRLQEEMEDAGPPLISRALLMANLLVFLAGLGLAAQRGLPSNVFLAGAPSAQGQMQIYRQILHETGSLRGRDLIAGQWWRLLSYSFVHGGLIHLGMNMYALYILGPILEQMWGRWRFLMIYLTSGLGGGCAAVLANPDGPALVGASGALCGLLASVVTWIFLNRHLLDMEVITTWRRNLVINFVLIVVISLMPGVSAMGHLGGAVAGMLVSVPLNFQRFTLGWRRLLALAGTAAVPVVLLGAVMYASSANPSWEKPKQELKDEQAWRAFQAQQAEALKEQRDFGDRLVPASRDARDAGLQAMRKANALFEQAPEKRGEDQPPDRQPDTVIKELAEAAAKLSQAEESLRQAAPYANERTELQRQVLLHYLEALRNRCTQAQELLEQRKPLAGEDHQEYLQRLIQVQLYEAPAQAILR